MTAEAPAPLTHRRVAALAGPIVLSNATVPLLGLVDAGVVGQMGAAAPLAAVGVGAAMLTAAYWLFGFLRMGTTGLAAQALGAGDGPEAVAWLIRAVGIGAAAGVAMIALQGPLIALALWAVPDLPEVEALAAEYMAIRVWGAPATIALYGVTGWLVAKERTGAVLVVQVAMNGLNILLDLWFVLGLGWGVGGVAVATAIAEVSGAAIGLWFCRDALRADWGGRARLLAAAPLRRMAAVNRDILIRSALLLVSFRAFLLLGGREGEAQLAANHVLLLFVEVTAYGLDGIAFATETLVGQRVGARDRAGLRRAIRLTALWAGGLAVAMAAGFALGGGALIDLLARDEAVREAARAALPWMAAAPVVAVASYMLDGIFIGATRTADMRNMMALSCAVYAGALWAFAPWGNAGLWAALLVFLAARGVTLAARYPALERALTRA